MELLKDKLKRELINGTTSINIKTHISGINWASLSVTSLCGSQINLNLEDKDFKLRFQQLISGCDGFEQGDYRIDNHNNKPIHSHFLNFENTLTPITLGSVFKMILGSEYKDIEESLNV